MAPPINRATLPQEFFDHWSERLLLQPEPQYLHAKLFKMALGISFNVGSMVGMPGRQFGGEGAPYQTDPEQGRLIMSDGIYDQAIGVVPELGKRPGHTININRPSFANTTYTQAAREVPSGTTISTSAINVSSEQVPITLKRFGGPYDSTNSRVAPYGIDRFDGSVMLHRPAQVVGLNLTRDFDRTLDSFGVALLDNANSTVRPNGMANDDSAAVAGDYPFSYSLLAKTERTLDDLNVPYFPNGRRAMVLHPLQTEQLGQDAQFNRQAVFERDFNPIFRGTYWKSIGNWDLFKSTTLTSVTNANTISVKYAQAFGPGAIGAGIGEMPRIAYAAEDNYGETALVIWLMYAGFATLDNRFIARITTS